MKPMVRVSLTPDELDLIANMMGIASASLWGEGDYQSWGPVKEGRAYDSLQEKVAAASRRFVLPASEAQ